jgi:hypothetical protein
MSWFHKSKQERLVAAIRLRREQAEIVRKHIRRREFYVLSPRVLDDAINEAKELPDVFEEEFQEAAPQHLRRAAELETQFWTALREARDTNDYTDDAYEKLNVRLSFIVAALIDLLTAEEEMITSPLVAHFLQLLDKLRAYARRGEP